MSQIKLDNVSGFPLIESVLSEAGLFHTQSGRSKSFDDHLQRAQARPDHPGSSPDPGPAAGPDRQPAADAQANSHAPPAADASPAAETQSTGDDQQQPAADGQSPDPEESPDVHAEDNLADQASPNDAAKNDPPATDETEPDAGNQEQPEAGAASPQIQITEAADEEVIEADASEAVDDPHQSPTDSEQQAIDSEQQAIDSEQPTVHVDQLPIDDDQPSIDQGRPTTDVDRLPTSVAPEAAKIPVDTGDVEEAVSEDDLTESEGEEKKAPSSAAAGPQVETVRPQEQASAEQPATEDDRPPEALAEDKPPADRPVEVPDETAGQRTGRADDGEVPRTAEPGKAKTEAAAASGRDLPDQHGGDADETANQRQQDAVQGSRAEVAPRPQRESGQENAPPDRVPQQAAERPPQTNAPVTSSEQAVSVAERQVEVLSGDTAKPAVSDGVAAESVAGDSIVGDRAAAQGEVPMRVSPGLGTRAESPQQPLPATEPGQVDQARFVQRVARAFRAMGQRNGTVRLRLSPPELGSLRLEISVRNGLMTARVEAETQTARNLLLDNLPALRERLAQQDIKVEQFNVDLMGRSPGGLPDRAAGDAASHDRDRSNGSAQTNAEEEGDEEGASDGGALDRLGEGNHLNVVI